MILKLWIIPRTGKLKWKCVNNLKNSIFNKLYMSGTAALSAAKNRRTATAPPAPGGYKPPQQKNESVNPQPQGESPKNPLQILYIHEMRLNKLESDHDTDKNDNVGGGLVKTLSDKISALESKCSALESKCSASESKCSAFEQQCSLLKQQYTILKEELSKNLLFSMETNRAFLLYKNDKEQQEKAQAEQAQAEQAQKAQAQAEQAQAEQAQAQAQAEQAQAEQAQSN